MVEIVQIVLIGIIGRSWKNSYDFSVNLRTSRFMKLFYAPRVSDSFPKFNSVRCTLFNGRDDTPINTNFSRITGGYLSTGRFFENDEFLGEPNQFSKAYTAQ